MTLHEKKLKLFMYTSFRDLAHSQLAISFNATEDFFRFHKKQKQ